MAWALQVNGRAFELPFGFRQSWTPLFEAIIILDLSSFFFRPNQQAVGSFAGCKQLRIWPDASRQLLIQVACAVDRLQRIEQTDAAANSSWFAVRELCFLCFSRAAKARFFSITQMDPDRDAGGSDSSPRIVSARQQTVRRGFFMTGSFMRSAADGHFRGRISGFESLSVVHRFASAKKARLHGRLSRKHTLIIVAKGNCLVESSIDVVGSCLRSCVC